MRRFRNACRVKMHIKQKCTQSYAYKANFSSCYIIIIKYIITHRYIHICMTQQIYYFLWHQRHILYDRFVGLRKILRPIYTNWIRISFLATLSVFPAQILLKHWRRGSSLCRYFGLHVDMRVIDWFCIESCQAT